MIFTDLQVAILLAFALVQAVYILPRWLKAMKDKHP